MDSFAAYEMLLILILLGPAILIIASWWGMFEKAGKPGWGAIIPIYNLYLVLEVARKPAWWLLLYLIPIVSIVVHIAVCIAIAENFGKSGGFAAGLVLLSYVFFPILAFGSAKYIDA